MRQAMRALLVVFVLTWVSSLAALAQDVDAAGAASTPQAVDAARADELAASANNAPAPGGVDAMFGRVNAAIARVVFYPVPLFGGQFPLAVLILVCGALFFSVRMGFPQFRSFRHAVDVVRGKYDDPKDQGEVSSFQALAAALSATVGLGNIAGVAIAIGQGGPGAAFWMLVAGFLGMASKFTECTLGQMYRQIRPDGRVMGGAMYYLSTGLKEMGLGKLGKVLAVIFAVVCIGASFGGGNSFQVNQSLQAVSETVPFLRGREWLYGLIMMTAIGVVIIGGLRRIATTAEKIVPLMCGIYVLACLAILLIKFKEIPTALGSIFTGAFNTDAMYGGFIGVLIVGFKRAAFSNEAGIGSAAIAHAAARVPHPSREGIVALLEPFIDTIVVCTMTALVIIITGAYDNPEWKHLVELNRGAALTSNAMGSVLSFFPYVLSGAVILFAYSTCISWSYYGERCWAYLFGDGSSMIYRILFIIFAFLGAIATATNILDFGDLLIFGMVLPNILGVVLLSGRVKRAYAEYQSKLAAGDYPTYK